MPSATMPRAAAMSFETRRQAADHQHQAVGAECRRLVDRALVVVERRFAAGCVGGREDAAAAEAGDASGRWRGRCAAASASPMRGDLVAPGSDGGDAVAQAAVDRLGEVPLLAHGGEIDREAVEGSGRSSRRLRRFGHRRHRPPVGLDAEPRPGAARTEPQRDAPSRIAAARGRVVARRGRDGRRGMRPARRRARRPCRRRSGGRCARRARRRRASPARDPAARRSPPCVVRSSADMK